MHRPLNHNQLRFIVAYLATMPRNGTAAYRRVYVNASYETAQVAASRLLDDPDIQAEIARREKELQADLELEARDVLREITLIATADPRELSEHYRGACRHCHGTDFKFQRRPSEFERDLNEYLEANKKAVKNGEADPDPLGLKFDMKGGTGFKTTNDPNPLCPECDGVGVSYEYFKDTRLLSASAARLFDGVERSKEGLKLKVRDRAKALDLAAQHLGVAKRTVEMSGKGGGPIKSELSLKDMDPTTAASIYKDLLGGA